MQTFWKKNYKESIKNTAKVFIHKKLILKIIIVLESEKCLKVGKIAYGIFYNLIKWNINGTLKEQKILSII